MRYTWDEEKNRRNIALHGIAFEDAKRIFEGPTERVDDRLKGVRHWRNERPGSYGDLHGQRQ
jgi:uncharacterized DUF497 family protein